MNMRLWPRLSILSSVLCGFFVVASPVSGGVPILRVTGTIHDSHGKPAQTVRVSFTSSAFGATTFTDDLGRFKISVPFRIVKRLTSRWESLRIELRGLGLSTTVLVKPEILRTLLETGSLQMNVSGLDLGGRPITKATKGGIDVRFGGVRAEDSKGRFFGIIVGISNYKTLPPLTYSSHDAREVARFFKKNVNAEREVMVFKDEQATYENVLSTIRKYEQHMKQEDTFFFYFSGHSGPCESASGISDVCLFTSDKDPYHSQINLDRLIESTRLRMRGQRIFILDSGLRGAKLASPEDATRGFIEQQPDVPYQWLRRSTGGSELLVTAGSPYDVVSETGRFNHGVFTYHLLEQLKEYQGDKGKRVVTWGELFRDVSLRVRDSTEGRQIPQVFGASETPLPLLPAR